MVLDNLEAVRDGATVVRDLVESTEHLTVLATSRLPLGLRVEHDVPVPPLETPEEGAPEHLVLDSPAVQMFLDRAASVDPGLELHRHLADVAALCRFVDGFPLAIELAAAHVRVLSPGRILGSLENDLSLLDASGIDLPERQRSLVTTIQWSFDQLSSRSQLVLERLALFERGFTVESVEAICADVPGVVESLTSIAKARLIRSLPSTVEVRFVLLGTVRAFARTRLQEHTDLPERHAALTEHLLARARSWAHELEGPGGTVTLGRYADAAADLDSAVDRATQDGRPDLAVELVHTLVELWVASGRMHQGLARCEALALHEPSLTPADQGRLHLATAQLAYHLGDWSRDEQECRRVLALDGVGASVLTAARCYLGGALLLTGRTEEGAALAEQALHEAVEAGSYTVQVVCLSLLAISRAIAGDFEGERAHYEQRLSAVQARGDLARLADTLNTLAEIALDEDDAATASAYAEESRSIAGKALPLEARDATITLARAAVVEHDLAAARERLTEGFALADRTGQSLAVAQCLRVAACLADLEGRPELAVRAFSCAQALSPSPSGTDDPIEGDLRRHLDAARDRLGPCGVGPRLAARTHPAGRLRARPAGGLRPAGMDRAGPFWDGALARARTLLRCADSRRVSAMRRSTTGSTSTRTLKGLVAAGALGLASLAPVLPVASTYAAVPSCTAPAGSGLQVNEWIGTQAAGTTGQWDVPASWSLGTVPDLFSADELVCIRGAATVQMAPLAGIQVNAGALDLGGTATVAVDEGNKLFLDGDPAVVSSLVRLGTTVRVSGATLGGTGRIYV